MDLKALSNLMMSFLEVARRNLASLSMCYEREADTHFFMHEVTPCFNPQFFIGTTTEQLNLDRVLGSTISILIENHYRDLKDIFRIKRETTLSSFDIIGSLESLSKLKSKQINQTTLEFNALAFDYINEFVDKNGITPDSDAISIGIKVATKIRKEPMKIKTPAIGASRVINKTKVSTMFYLKIGPAPWDRALTLEIH